MLGFTWVSTRPLPPHLDLTRRGWRAAYGVGPRGAIADNCAVLADRPRLSTSQRAALLAQPPARRRRVLFAGVEASDERAELLRSGFGDAVGDTSLDELAARAQRLIREFGTEVLRRGFGPLLLDVAAREGFVNERRLGLHPREFALLWRLCDTPGRRVTRDELLREVWHLATDPGTNRVEVHVSRLRARLRAAGIAGTVATDPAGGYRFVAPTEVSGVPALPLAPAAEETAENPLDPVTGLGEHAGDPWSRSFRAETQG